MAKFTFKLEALLRHREELEDQAQRALAKLIRQRMILQGQIRQMHETIAQSRHDLAAGLVGKVDVESISRFTHYSGQVAMRARQIIVKLAGLEKQIDAQRNALVEAVKARKAVELLRQRHFEQWRITQQRRESVELDELATQRYLRQTVGAQA